MPSWRTAAQARLDAATPGPWEDEGFNDGYYVVASSTTRDFIADVGCANDVDLIIHAPTDLRRALALLAEAEDHINILIALVEHPMTQAAYTLAASHGWQCPMEVSDKGAAQMASVKTFLATLDAEETP